MDSHSRLTLLRYLDGTCLLSPFIVHLIRNPLQRWVPRGTCTSIIHE
jgi:hypothetical protein